MKKINMRLLGSFMAILTIFSLSQSLATDTLRVDGSNTVLPVVDKAVQRWAEIRSNVSIAVSGPGSGAGFDKLIDKTTDIVPMSRLPKALELQNALDAGLSIKNVTIGEDALIVVVHNDNPITSLSAKNISDIFSGAIRDWTVFDSSISFDDNKIKIIERDDSSGTHDYFNDYFLNGSEVQSGELGSYYAQQASTDVLFATVAGEINAIGYGGLAYLTSGISAVKIDQVEASEENVISGEYPITRPLFLVWDDNSLSTVGKEFIDYILSPEGQFLVSDTGYIPVASAASSLSAIATNSLTSAFWVPTVVSIGIVGTIIYFKTSRKRRSLYNWLY